MRDMAESMNKMFGKIGTGMCRLSMNGEIAVKTSTGYKAYNLKKNRLINCSSFVFDIGEEFFFVIPTNKVSKGDIILVNGHPRCVIDSDKEKITVINYEDSTIDTILPERHVFMGNTYFYGKIVSMFGTDFMKGEKGMNKMMTYMLMSEMMKSGDTKYSNHGMENSMLAMMMLGGSMNDMFDGMFDFDEDDEEDDYTKSVMEHNAALGDEKEAE